MLPLLSEMMRSCKCLFNMWVLIQLYVRVDIVPVSAGLTLRQNKHVLRASMDKGHHTIRFKNTPKIPKI